MKFCKDCKYYCLDGYMKDSGYGHDAHRCNRYKKEINYINGELTDYAGAICTNLRGLSILCGPEAKWFEPKEK